MHRFNFPTEKNSLPSALLTLKGRVSRRKAEVESVIQAANAHMIADNSRMEVVLQAGEKDINEWSTLTNQLIENAFYNAEENYLSSLFATPPASPRQDELPPDEDRVAKIKAMLAKTAATEPADFDHAQDMEKLERRNEKNRKNNKNKNNRRGNLNSAEEISKVSIGVYKVAAYIIHILEYRSIGV